MVDNIERKSEASSIPLPSEKKKLKEEDSWAALFAGLTRSFALSVKRLGLLQIAYLKHQLRKRAFLTIGKQSTNADASGHISHRIGGGDDATKIRASAKAVKVAALAKNAVLGVAAFGVYDFAIILAKLNAKKNNKEKEIRYSDLPKKLSCLDNSVTLVGRNQILVPLQTHFAAGALSGLIQSIILDLWEIGDYWFYYRHEVSIHDHVRVGINHQFILRRAVFFSIGFSTLFGCYESIRRLTLQQMLDYLTSGSESVPNTIKTLESIGLVWKIDDTHSSGGIYHYDLSFVPLGAAFVAGGLAGQMAYVVNHYTKQWKMLAIHGNHTKKSNKSMKGGIRIKKHYFHPPKFRAVTGTFMPMALSFLAFQFGGELAEKLLDEDKKTSRPFSLFMKQT